MNSSVKIKIIFFFSFVIILGIILITIPISDTDENKEDNLATSSVTYVYKDVYTVGQYFMPENKVDAVLSVSCQEMGNGYFHIRGPLAAPDDTCTTRARLNFGFNNPYYENSGTPVSYTVKCTVTYNNWNDIDGYVALYVLRDDGVWWPIWAQSGLDGDYWEWPISLPLSADYFRDDSSTDFKIVGQSVAFSPGLNLKQPSVRVKINNLRVQLKYDINDIAPVDKVYTVCQYYTPEKKVNKLLSLSYSNTGDGHFHIQGEVAALWDTSTTRARLNLGFNNPYYVEDGRPASYTVKFSVKYKNWNDINGHVALYVLRDDGVWHLMWIKAGLAGGSWEWLDRSWTSDSFEYFRGDGSMRFKIVGESIAYTSNIFDPQRPSVKVNLIDLRVELNYAPEDIFPVEEVYTIGQYYTTENKVEAILSKSIDNMGNGHFHIQGPIAALWDTSTTRARLNFGFTNPYYDNSDAPDSYTVKCTVTYNNWNDINGYVALYVERDDGTWHLMWVETGLTGGYWEWPVSWTSSSANYYRDDGSMNFKIVGESIAYSDLFAPRRPSVRVRINNLRVQLNYASDDLFPKDGVYAACQYYTSESGVISGGYGLGNTGDGYFWVEGFPVLVPGFPSDVSARLNFGFNNPYYREYGRPESYIVKCTVTYQNLNDYNGYVMLYVLRDDGVWEFKAGKGGLGAADETFPLSWTSNSFEYFRGDGSMQFKIVGYSSSDIWLDTPSFLVIIEDLRVKLYYTPEADAGGPYYCTEGSPVTFDASDSFDLAGNELQYRWDFDNDGIWDSLWSTSPTAEHTWFDDYSGTVKVQVSDLLYTDTDTASITVINVDPILSGLSATSINEGSSCTLSATIVDPGILDTFLVTIDWGDGSPTEEFNYPAGTTSISETHTYSDDNPSGTSSDDYTIGITIEDDDGGISTPSLVTTDIYAFYQYYTSENKVEAILSESGDNMGNGHFHIRGPIAALWDTCTTRARLNFGFNNPYYATSGPPDSYTVKYTVTYNNWNDINGYVALYVERDDGTWHLMWVETGLTGGYWEWDVSWTSSLATFYRDDGSMNFKIVGQSVAYTDNIFDPQRPSVKVNLIDLGVELTYPSPIIITVSNVAPTLSAMSATSVNEGSYSILSGIIIDPGILDTFTLNVNWGDGSIETFTYAAGTTGFTKTHLYVDDNPSGTASDDYTITVTIEDDDLGTDTASTIVSVYNVDPTVDAGPDQTIIQGDTAIFSGSFTDPGSVDTHTFLWDFGDGSSPSATGSHLYAEYGVYTVTLTVTDDDVGVGSNTLIVVVMDIIPPTTTLNFHPKFGEEPPYYVSTATEFVLTAEDNLFGSGVDIIQYRIGDVGDWITYTVGEPFTISEIGGPYTVYYRSKDLAGNVEVAKSVDVIVNASELTYTGEVSGDYSDPVILEAILIDIATQLPISGKTIVFTIGSQTVNTETYNGVASVTLILDQPGGDYSVLASFVNDGEYLSSFDEYAFTINKEQAHAEYTGDSVIPTTADTITLRATVFDEDDGNWGDLTKIYVNFKIYTENYVLIETHHQWVSTTSVDGVGVALIQIPKNLMEGAYLVQIRFNSYEDDYYWGLPSDFVVLIIYEPTGDFVTGGGWIEDTEGNKGNFGFNVKYKKNGLPKGKAIYVYREGEWVFIVKSNAWIGMAIDHENNHSFFEAKCNIKQINSITGEIVWEEGNYKLRIDVWDHSKNGKNDVFQIRFYDKIGQVYHEAGFNPHGILQGGNIVIHVDDKKK